MAQEHATRSTVRGLSSCTRRKHTSVPSVHEKDACDDGFANLAHTGPSIKRDEKLITFCDVSTRNKKVTILRPSLIMRQRSRIYHPVVFISAIGHGWRKAPKSQRSVTNTKRWCSLRQALKHRKKCRNIARVFVF